jgi:hypothetical protein
LAGNVWALIRAVSILSVARVYSIKIPLSVVQIIFNHAVADLGYSVEGCVHVGAEDVLGGGHSAASGCGDVGRAEDGEEEEENDDDD